jgi:ABC-type antimicrobial peptide transport system permease subunit
MEYGFIPACPDWGGENIPQGYCDQQFTCRNHFDVVEKVYNRNVFITLVILGAISVAVGSFLGSNIVIGTSLSLAGVLSFVIASIRYWSSADDLIKVIILAIALAILMWVAVKKFKNNPPIRINE